MERNGRQSGAQPAPYATVGATAATCRVPTGEVAWPRYPGFRVILQLGQAPADRWLECNAHRFEGRILPGDLTCLPLGVSHVHRHNVGTSVGLLYVAPDLITQIFDGPPPDPVYDLRFRFQDPLVEHVMKAAVAGGSRLFLESAAVLILERLARVPSVETRHGSASRIRLATEYLHANLDQPISLSELSRVSGLSPSHLLRVFKATTTLSPHRYLTRARLEHARDLLAHGEAAIAEVALAVGFSSQSHFTWAFHNHFGTTPAAFQKSIASGRQSPPRLIADCSPPEQLERAPKDSRETGWR